MRELTIGKNDAGQRVDRFVSKAPEAIVNQEKARLADFLKALQNNTEQLAKLPAA